MSIRKQLTLFTDKADAILIEAIRKAYNPVQRALIDSHVTLCREDELADLGTVLSNLSGSNLSPVTITFGAPIRFDNGKGVLMPGETDNQAFQQLREKVLAGTGITLRKHQPHVTLMHPRNSTCTNEIFEIIKASALPRTLTYDAVSLIEQEADGAWRILQQFRLAN